MSLGFGLLIFIAVALGLMAIVRMGEVEKHSTMLAEEYLPEVIIANDLRGAANRTMYEMRGFGLTGEEQFFKGYEKEISAVEEALERARKLESTAVHLKVLKSHVEKATGAVNNYKSIAINTRDLVVRMEEKRKEMRAAADTYLANCSQFLDAQNAAFNKALEGNLDVSMKQELVERLQKINLVNDIAELGNTVRVGNWQSQAMRSPETMKKALGLFPRIEEKLNALQKITRQAANLNQIEETRKSGNIYKEAMSDFLSVWLENETLAQKRSNTGKEVIEACKETAEAGSKSADRIADEAVESLAAASSIMITGLAAALIIGCMLAFFITRSITKPVNRIIIGLKDGASQVASAAGQLSMSSQAMAAGASEQAASIEETSSSMEEMSSMTKRNAENAGSADGLMNNNNHVVTTANISMEHLTKSMQDISDASDQTSRIIKTIDEIAFQTNLLALNAAVEAARAGEAGAGFAVVADEVRNLAMRAATAAKDTARLIEETVKKVNDGSGLVSTTSEAFAKVTESSVKVGSLIAEISQASREQSDGIDQVNTAIAEMDKVVQQNAASAEESASAAEEMSAQAEQLREYVSELIVLVTGRNSQSSGTSRFPNTIQHPVKSLKVRPRTAIAAPTKKTVHPGAREIRSNQIVPFDDEDFADFDN